jgi:hypothetical protein
MTIRDLISLTLPRFRARENGTVNPAELDHFIRTVDEWAGRVSRRLSEGVAGVLELSASRLRLNDTTTATTTSTNHAIQIGPTSGSNLAISPTRIMRRTNGSPGALALNPEGGTVTVNGASVATVEQAVYFPTLANITLGSGGVNSGARYLYIGEPFSGGLGVMRVRGSITFGTGGFPAAGNTVSLPPGFQILVPIAARDQVGVATLTDTGSLHYVGTVIVASATTLNIRELANQGSNHTGINDLGASSPHPWAANDFLTYDFELIVQRT